MAKKNYYAVKVGYTVGIFKSWAECSQSVNGYKGAIYQGFSTEEDAKEFLGIENLDTIGKVETKGKVNKIEKKELVHIKSTANVTKSDAFIEPLELKGEYDFIAFVDGSYDKSRAMYGSGVVVLNDSQKGYSCYGKAGYDKWDQWNIVGEIESVKLALEIVKRDYINTSSDKKKPKVAIYHDLKNLSLWAIGDWKAKNEYTQEYVRYIEEASTVMDIKFIKVKAHSDESIYNDIADEEAKKAIYSHK